MFSTLIQYMIIIMGRSIDARNEAELYFYKKQTETINK